MIVRLRSKLGGVGKTSVARATADLLVKRGHSVIIVENGVNRDLSTYHHCPVLHPGDDVPEGTEFVIIDEQVSGAVEMEADHDIWITTPSPTDCYGIPEGSTIIVNRVSPDDDQSAMVRFAIKNHWVVLDLADLSPTPDFGSVAHAMANAMAGMTEWPMAVMPSRLSRLFRKVIL